MGKDTRYKTQDTNGDPSNVSQSSSHIEINHSSHQTSSVGESGPSTGSIRQGSGPSAGSEVESDASEVSNVNGHMSNVDLKTKVDELTADLQRIQADFVNFRRRSDDERGEFLTLAKQDVILQLLPVLDNIGRALSHTPDDLKDNPWAKGVSQIAKQAEETLRGLGVETFGQVGEPFDPNLHEAIGYEEGEGDQETISEVLQAGYKLGDKVIRHAMVRVARK